ncbi:MAG TPA: CBS domain-containing protein [Actinomycetota bacterium]|nr:CBS domain-containing protein [Actinomycetota bacterium]
MSPRAAWRLESIGFSQVFAYKSGKSDWLALGLPTEGHGTGVLKAGDVARRDTPTCGLGEAMTEVTDRVRGGGWDVCVVVNDENVVLGLHRARHLDDERDRSVEDRMIRAPSTFRPNVPAENLVRYMREHGLDDVPITTSDGKLIGLFRIEDAERALGWDERNGG